MSLCVHQQTAVRSNADEEKNRRSTLSRDGCCLVAWIKGQSVLQLPCQLNLCLRCLLLSLSGIKGFCMIHLYKALCHSFAASSADGHKEANNWYQYEDMMSQWDEVNEGITGINTESFSCLQTDHLLHEEPRGSLDFIKQTHHSTKIHSCLFRDRQGGSAVGWCRHTEVDLSDVKQTI